MRTRALSGTKVGKGVRGPRGPGPLPFRLGRSFKNLRKTPAGQRRQGVSAVRMQIRLQDAPVGIFVQNVHMQNLGEGGHAFTSAGKQRMDGLRKGLKKMPSAKEQSAVCTDSVASTSIALEPTGPADSIFAARAGEPG